MLFCEVSAKAGQYWKLCTQIVPVTVVASLNSSSVPSLCAGASQVLELTVGVAARKRRYSISPRSSGKPRLEVPIPDLDRYILWLVTVLEVRPQLPKPITMSADGVIRAVLRFDPGLEGHVRHPNTFAAPAPVLNGCCGGLTCAVVPVAGGDDPRQAPRAVWRNLSRGDE